MGHKGGRLGCALLKTTCVLLLRAENFSSRANWCARWTSVSASLTFFCFALMKYFITLHCIFTASHLTIYLDLVFRVMHHISGSNQEELFDCFWIREKAIAFVISAQILLLWTMGLDNERICQTELIMSFIRGFINICHINAVLLLFWLDFEFETIFNDALMYKLSISMHL